MSEIQYLVGGEEVSINTVMVDSRNEGGSPDLECLQIKNEYGFETALVDKTTQKEIEISGRPLLLKDSETNKLGSEVAVMDLDTKIETKLDIKTLTERVIANDEAAKDEVVKDEPKKEPEKEVEKVELDKYEAELAAVVEDIKA